MPIILIIGVIFLSIFLVTCVNIIMPYIWYEKLSTTVIKYMFIVEEYGYMTEIEKNKLKNELINQGFSEDKISIIATSTKQEYGEPIFLEVKYLYKLELPQINFATGSSDVDMKIAKYSVCKR